jgi:hypothetical protein
MAMTETAEAEPQFTQPWQQIFLMLLVTGLVALGAYAIYDNVALVIQSNQFLNGIIGGVFVVGVFACFWQVVQLIISTNWITGFVYDVPGHSDQNPPRLMAPLAALLRGRGKRMQISSSSTSSILDSVATRIEEARDITRYLVNLLIFLGLLGTFYGLATTVPAVVETIRSLAPQEGEAGGAAFGRLMIGLEAQLGGMGTAFASSLLGLAGSLVVGLLELFASHGQNRLYRELEDWLSSITRVGFASGHDSENSGDGGQSAAMVEYFGQQMESMHQMFTQADVSRALMEEKLGDVAESVKSLTSQLSNDQTATALDRLAASQERLAEAIPEMGRGSAGDIDNDGDAESRMHLRSIDVQLLRILEEIAAGRQEAVADLRTDLLQLTREVRKARNQQRQQHAANSQE